MRDPSLSFPTVFHRNNRTPGFVPRRGRQNGGRTRGAAETMASRILFRALPEIGDDVGAVLGAVQMEEHLDAGNERLRIGEPLVERLLVPDDIGGFERVGIAVIGQGASLAPHHAAVPWADVALVERM